MRKTNNSKSLGARNRIAKNKQQEHITCRENKGLGLVCESSERKQVDFFYNLFIWLRINETSIV